ncbi:MAG: hypothetical protein DKINENOH_04780 [bacterium]|nr:hypothetical protein [bacterium]
MEANRESKNQVEQQSGRENGLSAPTISLPKGGGAIRGIGEKFAANPVTGTGSMTVPIATSPGRSGFGPQLSLAYDSGAGNGPFGFGWSLSLPAITRKTDKGLPKYDDANESDVFILSGAEDLVPVLKKEANGEWQRETLPPRKVDGKTYQIQRYRPRIEGLFARIERWTNQTHPQDTFWRSISKDNITTWYGKDENSRIADPADPNRIFSWLICESHDDKGNVVVYRYKAEDSIKVDLSQAHEHNRTSEVRSANRYLKYIRYGNHEPYYPELARDRRWPAPKGATAEDGSTDWFFEVVFDYGEHNPDNPKPNDPGKWLCRHDSFSSYRAGFEVRTYRLCRRVLMFHHFPDKLGVDDYLVRSTEFIYKESPIASFITQVTQSGYVLQNGKYLKKSLPPLEFGYTEAKICKDVREIDDVSLKNLPYGVDGSSYQWMDLDGEGVSGILTEQADGWFYKRNLSPKPLVLDDGTEQISARFGPIELVATKPAPALAGNAQFLDLAGDGQVDLVQMDGPVRGFYERTDEADWESFHPFESWPNVDTRDPNLRFVDLDGDGHSDILITENEVFTWYPSLAEKGFDLAQRVGNPVDEEKGPKLIFADGTQSIYLADLSGDGMTDLVRIRNGEICYWPNLGYGRFGAKVTMDNAPLFDYPEQFNQQRIRLADIDGSGTTDIIYLGRNRIDIYRNEAGNRWSDPELLTNFPHVDNLSAVMAVDLLGNGTACLVWSSPLPGEARRPMRYIDLMGGQKPHLLVSTKNNLGAETCVHYAPSTKFYLNDKESGKPWITRLPFPVHVVERVETYDFISRNRFVTRYAYHHGYFDGVEREFRGFGMVEQWDTEVFAALSNSSDFPVGENIDETSHVPPVLTKTWFHTGIYLGRDHVSNFFAGLQDTFDRGEYYREPEWRDDDVKAQKRLLDDTVLPTDLMGEPLDLTVEEEREACRALKGAMLRQEIYALDEPGTDDYPYGHPYTVTEQNFTIKCLQPRAGNRHAVFFTHAREAISYHYERNPADPRVGHALTLEVDDYGNVLKSAAIGYGRRQVDPNLPLPTDQDKQTRPLITYTENSFTNAIESDDDYRTPLPCETCTYELTGYALAGTALRFQISDFVQPDPNDAKRLTHIFDSEIGYEQQPTNGKQRRLIEQVRSLYRPDDLGAASDDPQVLLPLGKMEALALPGESYKLAFTPELLDQVYVRAGQRLLPANPADVLEGGGADRGGYVDLDSNDYWWIPSGRVFYLSDENADAVAELKEAKAHFFMPRRFSDPFGFNTRIDYEHDLFPIRTTDAIGNTITAVNDYRVLQPRLVTDPNRNRAAVAFDALGMVVGTAVMGKPEEKLGDSLDDFESDLTQARIDGFYEADDPHTEADQLLKNATTRIVYDLERFLYTQKANRKDPTKWLPVYAATLARETHASDSPPPGGLKIQISFSYSDGFGREVQKKIQAEQGTVPKRDENGKIIVGEDNQPEMTDQDVSPRWVGSGWTIFNNKGKPVRQFEPFFTDTHRFEFEVCIGVSPVLFYDPVERVIATLHPNHTYEKVVFDPWRQETWDVNDTVSAHGNETGDPRTDGDIKGYVADYFKTQRNDWQTWYQARINGAKGAEEKSAAKKAAMHANTPTVACFDTLGRPFLTLAHNGFDANGTLILFPTRVKLDIEGNQRAVRDAKVQNNDTLGRIVMRYDYDMLGNGIHQASMEAGERWMLNDVTGKPIRAWDNRGHTFQTEYDELRRPLRSFVIGTDPNDPNHKILFERVIYGDGPDTELTDVEKLQANLRGKPYKQFDNAGKVTNLEYDFKGNLLRSRRQLAALDPNHKSVPDWSQNPKLENEEFESRTTFDALNRPITLTTPDNSVIRPAYNEANLLERVEVNLRGAAQATTFVSDIDYNAKGQRVLVEYGNGARTTYDYDPQTFRLTRLRTTRYNDTDVVQDLQYIYDPVGNITSIRDDAQQTIYFNNQVVEPHNEYVYDAIYRLINAKGREHIGQVEQQQPWPTWNDEFRVNLAHPHDGGQMRRYDETYLYDTVGNFEKLIHTANNSNGSWTREYVYDEYSLIEPGKKNNRLSGTKVGKTNNGKTSENYEYDEHGNMTCMPHLNEMTWDFKDQLQQVDLSGGGKAYYVYDAAGQRVRKMVEKNGGGLIEERLYLGGFEIFRKSNSNGLELERETLHIMADKKRIALVETLTQGNDDSPEQLIRYQFDNHLGSACLELDDHSKVISYEEFYPYGSTSYQAVSIDVDVRQKTYRYTGKERDEETGMNYHLKRYYATWLGRWSSSDPISLRGGINGYLYARNNPIFYTDSNGTQERSRTLPNNQESAEKFVNQIKQDISTNPNSPIQFEYKGLNVVVLKLPEVYIVESDTTFTGAATALDTPTASETVINTANYEGYVDVRNYKAGYRPQGQVIQHGIVIGGRTSPDTFYFSWTSPDTLAETKKRSMEQNQICGPPVPSSKIDPDEGWNFGLGDPPLNQVQPDVAFGGAHPLIIHGMPYGYINKYKPGAPSNLPISGDPGTENLKYLSMRSNAGFADLANKMGLKGGKVTMGIERESNLLFIVVQGHNSAPGMSLKEIRNTFLYMGIDDAVAWDASDSATLVLDNTIRVAPGLLKNITMPYGVGFRLR